jgi:hypothetical protein
MRPLDESRRQTQETTLDHRHVVGVSKRMKNLA